MTDAALLAALAIVDCLLAGFRAAAGREGRLAKTRYYRAAVLRGLLAGTLLVGLHVVLALGLLATSPAPGETWRACIGAAELLVVVFGGFATVVLAAFAVYFLPVGEFRVITSVVVFGPLTLMRPLVIVGGLGLAAAASGSGRVALLAASAGVSMLAFEHVLGRSYAHSYRRLLP